MAQPYLFRLDDRISRGLVRMDSGRREAHRSFLLSQQNDDGGFGGRGMPSDDPVAPIEGRESDLYYTAFGVRALAALRAFDREMLSAFQSICSRLETGRRVSSTLSAGCIRH